MMASQFDNQGPDVSDVVAEVSQAFKNGFKRFGPLLLLLAVVALGLLGIYKVDPGAQGVVRRFGAEHRRTGPGLHYAIPLIEEYDVVNVEEIRRVEVGFRGDEVLPEALMLTGDENIVEVLLIVQYRVLDPGKYLFELNEPDLTLASAAEVAIRTVVGQTNVDDVMTTGRARVQSDTRVLLQKLMGEYQSGIEITEVKLDSVDAPNEVKDAFNAVTRAREEKEKLVNEAHGYAEDRIPRARGEAEKILRAAEAYKEERVLRARGDAAKFLSVLQEYEKAKLVTRQRIHLETLERILKQVEDKVLIEEQVAKGALPVLQLSDRAAARAVVATQAPTQGEQKQ